MSKVLFLKGLPGCGKSTYAKDLMERKPNSWKRVNKDDLRAMVDDGFWSRDAEKLILNIQDKIILEALEAGKNVIVDNTHLAPSHEERIRQLVKGKADFEIEDFTGVPVEECIDRDLKRLKSVGEQVIRGMYNQYLRKPIPVIEYNPNLIDVTICDLDGTLSLLNGRNPYDASDCENDLLNEPVANLIKRQKHVILLSGREDKYMPQTQNFLIKHNINYVFLFMRKSGDSRPDSIVKREIYDKHIRDKCNVSMVIDDRLQVCRMWHELGLPLFRVGDPESSF